MEQESTDAAPAGAQKRKAHPLAPRIKRLMQTDEDVGKIAQATPHLIAMATEKFLAHVAGGAMHIAESRNAKTLQPAHIKAFVHSEAVLDFLKDAVASAPDLPDDDGKPKRKRKSKAKGGAAAKGADDEDDDEAAGASPLKKRAPRKGAGAKGKKAKEEADEEDADAADRASDEAPATESHAEAEDADGAAGGDAAAARLAVKTEGGQPEEPAVLDTLVPGDQQLPEQQEEVRWHGDGGAAEAEQPHHGGGWHRPPAHQDGTDVPHAAANGGGAIAVQIPQPEPADALQEVRFDFIVTRWSKSVRNIS